MKDVLKIKGPVAGPDRNTTAPRAGSCARPLPLAPEKMFAKVEVLSVAKIIADALAAVFDETSVSELFDGENQS